MKNEERTPEFFEFCKNYILDKIDGYEGCSIYACDLEFTLTEYMRCDGTFTYSTDKAKRYMIEWFYEAGKYSDYEEFNFGKRSNPFENVEAYLVRMVSEGVGTVISRCPLIDQKWNDDKFELTPEIIAVIKEQVEEQTDEDLF